MNRQIQHDDRELAALFEEVKHIVIPYLQNIGQHPTSLETPPALSLSLPEEGAGASQSIQLFLQQIRPLLLATSGPRYLGFVTGGGTPAAIVGDWLTSVFDQNTQFTHGRGDASAAVEHQTIQLLLDLFELPRQDFWGGFVTGATMSNFTALAVARQWLGRQWEKDAAREGITFPVKIYAAVPHSSALKSLAMLGLGSAQLQLVPTLPGREAIDLEAFQNILEARPKEPFILISSAGTVNSVDFDDLEGISRLQGQYRFWWHIDAAFGAFASLSPRHRHLLKGWEKADSITVDCHKWLNVPYDSGVYFIRQAHAPLQVQTFQNANAPYLGDPMAHFNYLNFGPENSRRFRALPVWFTLNAYGRNGYRQIVAKSIAAAHYFAQLLTETGSFALIAPLNLNVVCFTPSGLEERIEKLDLMQEKLAEGGKVFVTPTVYKGVPCLRAAFVNWRTTETDVEIAVAALVRALG